MAQERKHTDNAQKQRAYRERRAEARAAASAGYTDKELGRAVRELHAAMQYEAAQEGAGSRAAMLIGETPADTLRNISRELLPPPPLAPL